MLRCRACLWRCLRAFEPPAPQPRHFRRNALASFATPQQRSLQTATETSTRNVSRVNELSISGEEPWKNSAQAAKLKKKEIAARKRRPEAPEDPAIGEVGTSMWYGKRDPRISPQEWHARVKELQYLKDPLDLANFVKKELRKDKVKEMLQLARMASHSMHCIVSWNHIIDYYLAKSQVSNALKVFNEMKKRAQFPDSYTYTILLRGLSINAHHSTALAKAISVYHSMLAPNSRIEPSIIHTNAALNVCARALDMDALWGIAAKIPESGPNSANATTFTTILNAITQSLLIDAPKGESEQEVAARRERGVVEGRRMWEDIIGKWRNADLVMEEQLVCAMGRLLLIGSRPRDWDDVLSLVEQTMDIPRLVPRLGTPARHEAGVERLRAPHVPEEYRFDDDHLGPDKAPARGDEFLPLSPSGVSSAMTNRLNYATPSNNTLSMIQEACQKIVARKAAKEYWDMLTDPMMYAIVPDVNNLHQRLRVLRQDRASTATVEMLKEYFIGKDVRPVRGTFRIAMSTCVRDKNNHNSLRNAGQIMQMMMSTLPDADAGTVERYASLAVAFPLAKGDDLIEALTILQPAVKSLRTQLSFGLEQPDPVRLGKGRLTKRMSQEERQGALLALRRVFALYHKLLNEDMIPQTSRAPFETERARLSAFFNRASFKASSGKLELAKKALPEDDAIEKGEGKRKEGS